MTDRYSEDTAPQPRETTITRGMLNEVIRGGQPMPFGVLLTMVALVVVPIVLILHPRVEQDTALNIGLPLCAAGLLLCAWWLRRLGARSRSLAKRAFPVGATVTATDEDEALEIRTPAGVLDFGWEETKASTLNHTVLLRREDGLRLAVPRVLVPGTTAMRFGSGLAANLSRFAAKKPEEE